MLIAMATLNPVTEPLLVGLLTLILWKDGIQGLEFFWHLATRNLIPYAVAVRSDQIRSERA